MSKYVKDIASYLLIGIVVMVTVVSILAIWDVIVLEDIFWKTGKSLFVVFIASVVILFISSVVIDYSAKKKFS